MKRRRLLPILLALAALAAWAIPAGAAPEGNPFKLKPGANGKVCLGCHVDFEETIKQAFVHTPVKSGDCSDCHDPHKGSSIKGGGKAMIVLMTPTIIK